MINVQTLISNDVKDKEKEQHIIISVCPNTNNCFCETINDNIEVKPKSLNNLDANDLPKTPLPAAASAPVPTLVVSISS